MAKLTRETMTAKQLIEYRDYITNGWMPYHLADADAIITELAWIDAMLEREEEGDALFNHFVYEYDKFENEENNYYFYTDENGEKHISVKLRNERISIDVPPNDDDHCRITKDFWLDEDGVLHVYMDTFTTHSKEEWRKIKQAAENGGKYVVI